MSKETMTAAEKVLQWIKKYYEIKGTPNYGEIIAQLEIAIDEENKELKSKLKEAEEQNKADKFLLIRNYLSWSNKKWNTSNNNPQLLDLEVNEFLNQQDNE